MPVHQQSPQPSPAGPSPTDIPAEAKILDATDIARRSFIQSSGPAAVFGEVCCEEEGEAEAEHKLGLYDIKRPFDLDFYARKYPELHPDSALLVGRGDTVEVTCFEEMGEGAFRELLCVGNRFDRAEALHSPAPHPLRPSRRTPPRCSSYAARRMCTRGAM